VYKNGPAKIDADYRPAYKGEAELLEFIANYLNVSQLDVFNKNTGTWIANPHPEDCEQGLYQIKNYFAGDISELKEHCGYMPDNRLKLLVGVETDDQGRQFTNVYNRLSLRNGTKSYTKFKDSIDGNAAYLQGMVFSDAADGTITNIHEYVEDTKETNLSSTPAVSDPVVSDDPFKKAAALPEDDLPFGSPDNSDADPFANMK
jgi:hypothetical protein